MLLIERWREMDSSTDMTTNEHEIKSVRQALINMVDRSGRCPTPILAPLAALFNFGYSPDGLPASIARPGGVNTT
jgi:hypothetical protein